MATVTEDHCDVNTVGEEPRKNDQNSHSIHKARNRKQATHTLTDFRQLKIKSEIKTILFVVQMASIENDSRTITY